MLKFVNKPIHLQHKINMLLNTKKFEERKKNVNKKLRLKDKK